MAGSGLKTFNYAVGMFGTSIPINMLKTYAPVFYVDRLGLTTIQLSVILFVYTFIDAIDNPIYGFLSDRTRTRWGRRRPWLMIGTPLLVLSFIVFYNPPAFLSGESLFAYCMLFYILSGTLDSVINANYGSLFPELFRDDAGRAAANALRQAFQLVAMVVSIALTPVVTKAIGYGTTALLYGILGGAVILYMAFSSRESSVSPGETKPALIRSVVELFTNVKFWLLGFTNAFYSASMAIVMVALPFFVKYAIKIPEGQATILFGTVLLVAFACVAPWAYLVRKLSVIPVWRTALAVLAAAFVPLYFANSLATALVGGAFVGFGYAGCLVTIDIVGTRIMDEDTKKHSVRREGIIVSAMGFMNRLSGLFTGAAFLLIFVLFGFESGKNPGPVPGSAARFLMAFCPAVLMLVSFVLSFLVDFERSEKPASIPETSR